MPAPAAKEGGGESNQPTNGEEEEPNGDAIGAAASPPPFPLPPPRDRVSSGVGGLNTYIGGEEGFAAPIHVLITHVLK